MEPISEILNTIYHQANSALTASSHFQFKVADQPESTFKVSHWQGTESISGSYRYILNLSTTDDLDIANFLGKDAALCIARDGAMLPIHGYVSEICHLGELATERAEEYQFVIESPLGKLNLIRRSRVFLNLDLKGVIEQILLTAGFTADSFKLDLKTTYPVREYIAQYNETDFDFLSRLLEHAGVFYYYVQQEERALLVIQDDSTSVPPATGLTALIYMPTAGQVDGEETVHLLQKSMHYFPPQNKGLDQYTRISAITSQYQNAQPGKLRITDNDDDAYRRATRQAEAGYLVRRRQQAINCQRTLYVAETNCRGISAGITITISGHPYKDYNGYFLVVKVRQQGGQVQAYDFDNSPITASTDKTSQQIRPYHNELLMIKKDIPYRPPVDLDRSSQIRGVFAARIASPGGERAYLDDHGCYRLKMPFNTADTQAGGDSHAMETQGLADSRTPLHAGEVVHLSCLGGDPNWPVIWAKQPTPAVRQHASEFAKPGTLWR